MERRGPKIRKLIKENEERKAKELKEQEKFDNSPEGKLFNKISSIIMEFINETYEEGCCECGIVYPQNEYQNKEDMYNEIRKAITFKRRKK